MPSLDLSVLPDLTDQDLEKLGVFLGHRRKLLRAIKSIKRQRRYVGPQLRLLQSATLDRYDCPANTIVQPPHLVTGFTGFTYSRGPNSVMPHALQAKAGEG
jgi:hypothetical protein